MPVSVQDQLRVYVRALDPRALLGGQRGFVLFAQGRSGSTLLGELIGGHPEVVYEDEILRLPVRLPRAWAAGCRARHLRRHFGFHVKVYQLTQAQGVADPNRWLASMQRMGWDVVYLHRANLARQALSTGLAASSGLWHVRDDTSASDRLVVPPELLVRGIEDRVLSGQADEAALRGVPHVRVEYERDLLDETVRQDTLDRVLAHLGLDPTTAHTDLRRTGSDRIDERVANAQELRAALIDTPWEGQLD